MTIPELERRLAAVEETVELLLVQLAKVSDRAREPVASPTVEEGSGQPWYIKGAGRFKDDPIFDEIVRLGREYRESLPLAYEEFEEEEDDE